MSDCCPEDKKCNEDVSMRLFYFVLLIHPLFLTAWMALIVFFGKNL